MPGNDGDSKARAHVERFESISQSDVPKGRDGKHKHIVLELLDSLANLKDGDALKVDLGLLPDSKENIRAALSRATKARKMDVATSSTSTSGISVNSFWAVPAVRISINAAEQGRAFQAALQ